MGVGLFQIVLDNPSGVFFGGQMVNGAVKIHIEDEPKKARGLKLVFKGESKVRWKETHGTGDNRRTVTYSSRESYLNQKVYLIGDSSGEIELLPGHHSYPFSFQLPPTLPSSYESRIGKIRYSITAAIDVAWAIDPNVAMVFSVIGLLDLNMMPNMAEPFEQSNSKDVGCLCFSSGNVTTTARVGKRGFVPGEMIPLSADVANESNKQLGSTKWKLVQTVKFRARNRTKTITQTVAKAEHPGNIEGGQNDTWTNEFLPIPPLPPSNTAISNGCQNILIGYTLIFEVDVPMAFDPTLPFIIEIGSVPFRQFVQNQNWMQPPPDAPPLPIQGWTSSFPDIPPPSFTAATMDEDPPSFDPDSSDDEGKNQKTNVNADFRPIYPTFNFSS